jgi:hypothetical protein
MIARTWDGLPVSPQPPRGATVVVFRQAADRLEPLPPRSAVRLIEGQECRIRVEVE